MASADPQPLSAHATYADLAGEHFHDLWHVATLLLDDVVAAQNLVQDALVQGYRRFDTAHVGPGFKAWLLGGLWRLYVQAVDDETPRARSRGLAAADPMRVSPPGTAEPVLGPPDLEAALRSLPVSLRAPVVFCDVAGFVV